jgi:hypothetical protein
LFSGNNVPRNSHCTGKDAEKNAEQPATDGGASVKAGQEKEKAASRRDGPR